jgi:hypothetical protein
MIQSLCSNARGFLFGAIIIKFIDQLLTGLFAASPAEAMLQGFTGLSASILQPVSYSSLMNCGIEQ